MIIQNVHIEYDVNFEASQNISTGSISVIYFYDFWRYMTHSDNTLV